MNSEIEDLRNRLERLELSTAVVQKSILTFVALMLGSGSDDNQRHILAAMRAFNREAELPPFPSYSPELLAIAIEEMSEQLIDSTERLADNYRALRGRLR